MEKIDKRITSAVKALDTISQLILFLLMVFFFIYIVLRLFGVVIFGTYEIAQYSCMLVVVLALARNDYKAGNIVVTVFSDALPPLGKKIVRTFGMLFTLAVVVFMEYGMITYALTKKVSNALTSSLKIPIWIFIIVIIIGFVLLICSICIRLVQLWNDYVNETEKGSSHDEIDVANAGFNTNIDLE